MKKSLVTCVLLAVALACGTAMSAQETRTTQSMRQSAPKGITEPFFSCVNAARFDNAQIGECIVVEKKVQDTRLNKAYSQIMGKANEKTKASVRSAERAWIDFNAKSVAAETDIGGANQVTNVDVAQSELFRYCRRANTLEDYFSSVGE